MKYRYFIFLCIMFLIVTMFQSFELVEAVSYDTEIGLTFNSDVAAGSDSSTAATSESSTEMTTQNSRNISLNKDHFPETGIKKTNKSDLAGLLPSTGSKNSFLYLASGLLIVITVFVLIGFKTYKALTKDA